VQFEPSRQRNDGTSGEKSTVNLPCTRAYPAAHQSRRLDPSPTDALIDLKVGYRRRCQIPACWLDLRPVIHLRVAVLP